MIFRCVILVAPILALASFAANAGSSPPPADGKKASPATCLFTTPQGGGDVIIKERYRASDIGDSCPGYILTINTKTGVQKAGITAGGSVLVNGYLNFSAVLASH